MLHLLQLSDFLCRFVLAGKSEMCLMPEAAHSSLALAQPQVARIGVGRRAAAHTSTLMVFQEGRGVRGLDLNKHLPGCVRIPSDKYLLISRKLILKYLLYAYTASAYLCAVL